MMRIQLTLKSAAALIVAALLAGCANSARGKPARGARSLAARQFVTGSDHLKYFGYYDFPFNAEANPLAEQKDHVNFTAAAVFQWNPSLGRIESRGVAEAEANHIPMILWPPYFDGRGVAPAENGKPCRLELDPAGNHFSEWVAAVRPHLDNVLGFIVDSEPDLQCDYSDSRNLSWDGMKAHMEAQAAALKSAFGKPMMIVFSQEFPAQRFPFTMPRGIDVAAFDCYGDWQNCAGTGYSYPNLLRKFESLLLPEQRVFLIPDAMVITPEGSSVPQAFFSESDNIDKAGWYYELALSDPKVIGLMPFVWYSYSTSRGTRDVPALRAKWTEIGKAITGGPSAPQGTTPPKPKTPPVAPPSPVPDTGTICVTSDAPSAAYFVRTAADTFGWNGSRCFEGHPVGEVQVSAPGFTVVPSQGVLAAGQTLQFRLVELALAFAPATTSAPPSEPATPPPVAPAMQPAPPTMQPPAPAAPAADSAILLKPGKVCVDSNSATGAYFVEGPDQAWGWNGSKCFEGRPAGRHRLNTDGGYGYVPSTISASVNAEGDTITFLVRF